jgi:hypothetical protein
VAAISAYPTAPTSPWTASGVTTSSAVVTDSAATTSMTIRESHRAHTLTTTAYVAARPAATAGERTCRLRTRT